jgi:hypothetical protein
MGASFYLGLIQSVFKLEWSYYCYLSVLSIIFTSGSLSLAGIVKKVSGSSTIFALFISFLSGILSNGYLFGAQFGFFPQTFGLAYTFGIIFLLPYSIKALIDNKYTVVEIFLLSIPFSLIISSLILCYSDMFMLLGLGLLIYLVYFCIKFPNHKGTILKFIFITSLLVLLLVNIEVFRVAKIYLGGISGVVKGENAIGWPVIWNPLEFIGYSFGFKSTLASAGSIPNGIDKFLSNFLFPLTFIFIVFQSYKILKDSRDQTIILIIIINIIYWLVFIKFRYFSVGFVNGEVGHTFLQFKIAKWLAPFNLSLLCIAFAYVISKSKPFYLIKKYTILLILLIGIYFQLYISPLMITGHFLVETGRNFSPFTIFTELRSKISGIPKDEVIYLQIPHENHKLTQMVAYVLADRKLAGKYEDGYIRGSMPENQRDMDLKEAKWILAYVPFHDANEEPLRRIGPFYLTRAPFDFYALRSLKGAYGIEGDKTGKWNWINNSAEYFYEFTGIIPPKNISLDFEYLVTGMPRKLEVTVLNNENRVIYREFIDMKGGWGKFSTHINGIGMQEISIVLSATGDAVRLSNSDARTAKFLVKNLNIKNNIKN